MNKEDYFKYYIQGSDHYLIPKDVFIELFDEMENWREEAKKLKEKYLNAVADYETTMFEKEQLKKQLEEYENEPLTNKISRIDCVVSNIYSRNKTQQKEFIEYLEDYLKLFDYMCIDEQAYYDMIEEILQKYKSIIGDDK